MNLLVSESDYVSFREEARKEKKVKTLRIIDCSELFDSENYRSSREAKQDEKTWKNEIELEFQSSLRSHP